jgi:hypothetical protein
MLKKSGGVDELAEIRGEFPGLAALAIFELDGQRLAGAGEDDEALYAEIIPEDQVDRGVFEFKGFGVAGLAFVELAARE